MKQQGKFNSELSASKSSDLGATQISGRHIQRQEFQINRELKMLSVYGKRQFSNKKQIHMSFEDPFRMSEVLVPVQPNQ
jgi:hypothetical protein